MAEVGEREHLIHSSSLCCLDLLALVSLLSHDSRTGDKHHSYHGMGVPFTKFGCITLPPFGRLNLSGPGHFGGLASFSGYYFFV